jgi:uncharacterized protein YjbJ (UPF0337 family)
MAGETIRNKAEELKGQAKEKLGEVTDDHGLQAEGAVEKMKAKFNQAAHEMSDRAKDDDGAYDFGN